MKSLAKCLCVCVLSVCLSAYVLPISTLKMVADIYTTRCEVRVMGLLIFNLLKLVIAT
jgi:hypothetical protein